MKYLIAGLGNIGAEYADTRHNIGFTILDTLAGVSNIAFVEQRYGAVTEYKHKGKTFVLLKPNTYVNLSGKAINYWLQKEKIDVANLLVVLDDLSLPFGALRIKSKGSDAGHNGLKNINEILGHQNYPRLRFGIGNDFAKGRQVEFVLGKWTTDEQKMLIPHIERSIEAIHSFANVGIERTMNFFNT